MPAPNHRLATNEVAAYMWWSPAHACDNHDYNKQCYYTNSISNSKRHQQ